MESVDKQLYSLLGDLAVLHQVSNKTILSKHGLRRARYYSMHHLYLQPDLTLGQLSDRTLVARASTSRMVYQMEQEGLVRRMDDEEDRRLFTLSLTEKGLAFYEKVKVDLDADIQKRFEALDEPTKATLLELNVRLRDTLLQHTQWQEESE